MKDGLKKMSEKKEKGGGSGTVEKGILIGWLHVGHEDPRCGSHPPRPQNATYLIPPGQRDGADPRSGKKDIMFSRSFLPLPLPEVTACQGPVFHVGRERERQWKKGLRYEGHAHQRLTESGSTVGRYDAEARA